ncbi:hypothetical protein SAMN05428642_101972 [Flaviramulus basaltis]|uniref:Uncharacterized protein n=1 Tax=Flaviramulus basaltis TaxID=369401 RepID=A0A1K2IDJ3_9FLAO|nr:hypothetical protein [Flaviramulus basaltis]SFZ90500.1 hypothetical protein SAMN05428642_101972 [Flaviramulus basaltis]
MKNKKNTVSKTITVLSIIFALTFTSNTYATGWWWFWSPPTHGQHDYNNKKCGKCGRTSHFGKCNKGGGNDSIPLDGGLSILLLGAAAFGVKKLRENKK